MRESELRPRWEKECSWQEVAEAVESLEAVVKALVSLDTVRFCHNDLLAGNVIVRPDKSAVDFIDYEYASANYRGYDIGNHFNEQCGGLKMLEMLEKTHACCPTLLFRLCLICSLCTCS